MRDMGVTHYFPFGYEACSTGGYCESDRKSWLKEGEFTAVVLINILVIKLSNYILNICGLGYILGYSPLWLEKHLTVFL